VKKLLGNNPSVLDGLMERGREGTAYSPRELQEGRPWDNITEGPKAEGWGPRDIW